MVLSYLWWPFTDVYMRHSVLMGYTGLHAMRCCYNEVNLRPSAQKRHPKPTREGELWAVLCIIWTLNYLLFQPLQYYMQYHIMLNRVITVLTVYLSYNPNLVCVVYRKMSYIALFIHVCTLFMYMWLHVYFHMCIRFNRIYKSELISTNKWYA